MILQNHSVLNEHVRKAGCGFLSVIWHAVRKCRLVLAEIADINNIYDHAVASGAMQENCFIDNWELLFNVCGMEVRYTGRHEDPSRTCAEDEIEILRYPGHFVAGDGNGVVTYDSYGESNAVANHPMHSKRIFKVL